MTNSFIQGLYRLVSAESENKDKAVSLRNNDWNYGPLQLSKKANKYDQWFLIAQVPAEDCYNIIHCYTGTIVGLHQLKSTTTSTVTAGPHVRYPQCVKWRFSQNDDKSWRIHWVADPVLVLDLSDNNSHGILEVLPQNSNSHSQHWFLEAHSEASSRNDFAHWCSHVVDDSTKLSMLNIPASHQSLALHTFWGSSNPQCQTSPPYAQLLSGIRKLDCRFDVWPSSPPCLYARHGIAKQGYTLTALLHSLKIFLQNHPHEFVLVSIRNERGHPNKSFFSAFWTDFSPFLLHHPDLFYTYAKPSPDHSNPSAIGIADICNTSLGDVRGKVVLLIQRSWTTGIHAGLVYGTDEAIFGRTRLPSGAILTGLKHSPGIGYNAQVWVWRRKVAACRANIEAAMKDKDPEHYYSTSWNASRLDWTILPYNPCHFFAFARKDIEVLCEKLPKGGGVRAGVVWLDFVDALEDAVKALVRSNSGCGEL